MRITIWKLLKAFYILSRQQFLNVYSNKCQTLYHRCYLCQSKITFADMKSTFCPLPPSWLEVDRSRVKSFNIIFTAVSCQLIGLIMTETSGGSVRLISTTFPDCAAFLIERASFIDIADHDISSSISSRMQTNRDREINLFHALQVIASHDLNHPMGSIIDFYKQATMRLLPRFYFPT